MGSTDEIEKSRISAVGSVVDQVNVSIGPRFLNLFSEHMYSSPNKAFEELVSNSWDAGAGVVYIGMPEDLHADEAAIWVLDNGESMDVDGFGDLWAVATSKKRLGDPRSGRPQIGKFGIGKLATYLLTNELTYVCRASDGLVRAVTMDYRRIDADTGDPNRLHIPELPLDVRVLQQGELEELLAATTSHDEIVSLLGDGVPKPSQAEDWEDEFGGIDTTPPPNEGTWTLTILSLLKQAGKTLQPGWIRWLLRTALPLGSSMVAVFRGETLAPSKVEVEVSDEWILGENLGITSISLPNAEIRAVTEEMEPYPHLTIEGIDDRVTGRVRLYQARISGGKSDVLAASNGFHVNILGRVINLQDPYFGIKDLNHSAWAKFRATVRADGLDGHLAINREDIQGGEELVIFQAFLRALFNKCRSAHDAAIKASWPNVAEVLTESWSAVPLEPLRRVVGEGLRSSTDMPAFVDVSGVSDVEELAREWEQLKERPRDVITDVVLEPLSTDEGFVKFDVSTRRVIVNQSHPFVREHSETHEQQLLLRDAGLVELLTQACMLDLGIGESQLREVLAYRDQTLRLVAQVRRRTGIQIADLLLKATTNWKALERILGDAFEYMGFAIKILGQPGEPEGVATAPMPPAEGNEIASYSFTYDAKSSKDGKVATGDINTAGLKRHRIKHNADHTLVVGPDFQSGALQEECEANSVTPMRANDLAALLIAAGAVGPLNLSEFRSLFDLHDPDEVGRRVAEMIESLRSARTLSLDLMLAALEQIGYEEPNTVTVSVIADRIGQMADVKTTPTRREVGEVVRGLAVLMPNLVRVTGEDVFLSTSPAKLREAIRSQIAGIPPEFRFGVDDSLSAKSDDRE